MHGNENSNSLVREKGLKTLNKIKTVKRAYLLFSREALHDFNNRNQISSIRFFLQIQLIYSVFIQLLFKDNLSELHNIDSS